MNRAYLILFIAALSSGAFAQVIISAGTSTFGWTSNDNIAGPSIRTLGIGGNTAEFRLNGSPDHLFQHWWWYRVNGVNTREFALSTQAEPPFVSGNTMLLTYREPEGFTSTLSYTINRLRDGSALVTGTNLIRNESSSTLTFSFFNYFDFDIFDAPDDIGLLLSSSRTHRIKVFDADVPVFAEYQARDVTAYQAATYAGLLLMLVNNAINNLNNTGLPYRSDDISSGMQWNFTLGPGQSLTLQTSMSLHPSQ